MHYTLSGTDSAEVLTDTQQERHVLSGCCRPEALPASLLIAQPPALTFFGTVSIRCQPCRNMASPGALARQGKGRGQVVSTAYWAPHAPRGFTAGEAKAGKV